MYIGLGILYVVLLVVLGVKTARNRRWVLFALGFLLPLLWVVGAVLPPQGMSRVDALERQRDRAG
jgi:hypothetical protein